MQKHTQTGEEEIGKIRNQVAGRLSFNREWKIAPPNPRQKFLARLNRALGPAVLLRLETIHVHWQLRRRNDVGKKNKFPSRQLRAITQIEIFAKRVVLPPARFFDAGLAPQPRGAIEIEKPPAAAPGRLLEQKMPVQKHGLHPREQRVTAIQMAPARLDHANFRVGEIMDRPVKQFWWRDEIGIENANKLAGGRFESDRKRAGFKTGPVDSMNELNIETALT